MESILTLHIIGAIATFGLATASLVAIRRGKGNFIQLRRGILSLGLFQVVSGGALIAIEPQVSLARICIVSLAYLGAVFGIELALRRRIIQAETLAK